MPSKNHVKKISVSIDNDTVVHQPVISDNVIDNDIVDNNEDNNVDEEDNVDDEDCVDEDDGVDDDGLDDNNKKIILEKKKESYVEMTTKIDNLNILIKGIDKEINDITKEIKVKEKSRNDYQKQINNIYKVLNKTHCDEVNKARKEKKKRKGNINGGFNKECLVPDVLRIFLNLPEDTYMARPKVMSALNNKFTELKLKSGQNTTLDSNVVEKLGLSKEYEGKCIKFTEFQAFLASFYPKKKEQEIIKTDEILVT